MIVFHGSTLGFITWYAGRAIKDRGKVMAARRGGAFQRTGRGPAFMVGSVLRDIDNPVDVITPAVADIGMCCQVRFAIARCLAAAVCRSWRSHIEHC
jgi:hypothetical protein